VSTGGIVEELDGEGELVMELHGIMASSVELGCDVVGFETQVLDCIHQLIVNVHGFISNRIGLRHGGYCWCGNSL